MSDPVPQDASGGADLAAAALRAAQQAVSDLQRDTAADVAASGGDDAAARALESAQEAIAAAKSVNEPFGSGGPVGGTPIGQAPSGYQGGFQGGPGAAPQSFSLPSFGAGGGQARPEGIDLLSDVNLNVKIELGRTRMLVEDVLRLGEGSVVELDKLAGDPVDVYVNDRHVARGEVLVLNDNFCVRINEIVASVSEGGPGPAARAARR